MQHLPVSLTDKTAEAQEGLTNASLTPGHARHRWYFYKEGFSPEIVTAAIKEKNLAPDEVVLDPFNGSGTTTLVAASMGLASYGFEVNPFSAFLAKAKSSNVQGDAFAKFEKSILRGIRAGAESPLNGFSSFTKTPDKKKWLFNQSVLTAFQGGMSVVDKLESKAADLYKMALLTSVMENCNAVKDGKCLRYRIDWQEAQFDKKSFLETFVESIKAIQADLNSAVINREPQIVGGDSRVLLRSSVKEKFTLCVTSPPYLNSFDYTDIYRPELFLGGFVKTQQQLYDLRMTTVRSHIQAMWEAPVMSDFGPLYSTTYASILAKKKELWHARIPDMIQAYFEDMYSMLCSLRATATDDASIWLVVSTSAYVGVEIPVDLIIADLARKANWYLREVQVLRYLRSSSQSNSESNGVPLRLRESLVILDARKP